MLRGITSDIPWCVIVGKDTGRILQVGCKDESERLPTKGNNHSFRWYSKCITSVVREAYMQLYSFRPYKCGMLKKEALTHALLYKFKLWMWNNTHVLMRCFINSSCGCGTIHMYNSFSRLATTYHPPSNV